MNGHSFEDRVPGWPEYLEQLKATGRWKGDDPAIRELLVREWRALADEQYASDEAPIVAEVQAAGVAIKSVWDMVSRKESFPGAMPVLCKHLKLDYPPKVREGIARAMSDGAARPYWDELVRLYKRETDENVRDALAVALCGAAGPEQFDELISLSLDPANGKSRVVLIWALERRIPVQQAEPVLATLEKDPTTKVQAEASLKFVRAKMARKGR
ncbi:MAG: hypothetical protein HC783_19110 [Rhodobacteraceae bacterium]|nr:hypothetical protein [Paracoccaceae bacterium]